jgi:hypothetical protein
MATDSILGLFTSPQQYQQALQTEALNQGIKMAQLSPLEAGRAMGYAGAAQIGRGLVGALGGEDPQLKMMSLRNQLAQGKDFTSYEGWTKYTQELQQAGDLQGAAAAAQRATDLRSKFEERQADRDARLEAVRVRAESEMQRARERGESQERLKQMELDFRAQYANLGGNVNDLKRQVLEQQLGDLKSKAAERESAAQSQSMGRVAAFDSALDTLDIIAKHPGKKDVVGALTGGVMSIIPGTNAAGFASQLETFKAQTFIPQVSALKGMGALSDAEGKKLTAAVGALDTKMKPAEFDASLNRIRSDLEAAKQRAAKMPGMSTGNVFNSVEEATRANLPKGTIITIGGRRAVVE